MTGKRKGCTLFFESPICITGYSSIVGPSETEGPYGEWFDRSIPDALWREDTFEKCEKKLFTEAVKLAVEKAGADLDSTGLLFGGDLLNQIISAGYSARDLGLPFLGIYGACSTISEGMLLAAAMLDGGFTQSVVCAASSHYATSERQFRFPLELGTPKTPNSQNTVTGSAAAYICKSNEPGLPRICSATVGRVVDAGITDANNMGAAMAPAAVETVLGHLEDTGLDASYYDRIITGDLGHFGAEVFCDMTDRIHAGIRERYFDCGAEILRGNENEYCGGSGCACGATMLMGYFLKNMQKGLYKRLLFVATGALLSPTSVLQSESIPGVAHAVAIERS